MRTVHKWAAAATLAAMGAAVPAQAQAHCWNDREFAAAQVRELQIKLMVTALRCRAARMDISADYDEFVASQREAIDRAGATIKQHFAAEGGTQADYDRFSTSLANGYGDDQTSDGACAEAAMIAHDASMVPSGSLEPFAAARLFPANLPGGRCGVAPAVVAAASSPSAPLPPVVFAAPPAPVMTAAAAPAPAPVPVQIAARVAPANLPIAHPDPAPIIPIDGDAEGPAPAPAPAAAPVPVMVAQQAAPVPQFPADVLAAMAVMARYQASLQAQSAAQAPAQPQMATLQH